MAKKIPTLDRLAIFLDQIKILIPTVNNPTITIKQAGTQKGTFTLNQSGNTTIELTDNNTTYSAATTSANGLMSSSDKSKLDGIAAGATKYTLPAATSSALGGVKTGSNITNSSGTISVTKANVISALGYTPPTTNTTYGTGTASTSGITKLYTETGTATDGTMTQKAICERFDKIEALLTAILEDGSYLRDSSYTPIDNNL